MSNPLVTIYGDASCPYCGAARMLLTRKSIKFTDINITKDDDKRREMQERSGSNSVPQIFVGDRHVGGFDQLNALEQEGQLDTLLGELSAES